MENRTNNGTFSFKNKYAKNLFKNEKWLKQKYVKNEMTVKEISDICFVNVSTIHKYLRKYNIKVRPNYFKHIDSKKLYQNKEWLYKAYYEEKLSLSKIAKQFDVTIATIINWMNKFNIKRRNNSECRTGNLNPKFKGFFISQGYKYIYSPELAKIHNRKISKGNYIQEHVLVMSNHINKIISNKECIHHKDGDRLNNDINNLQLFSSNSEHTKYEQLLNTFIKKLLFGHILNNRFATKEFLLNLFNNFVKEQC